MYSKYPYTDFHRLNADWILEKTQECMEAVEGMESDVTDLQGRMIAAEGNITGLNTRVHNTEDDVSRLGRSVTANEANISTLQDSVQTLESDVDTLQTGLGLAEQNIQTHTDWLENHEGRLDTAEANIHTLQGQMNGALQAIDATEDAVGVIEGRLDTVENSLSDAEDAIADLDVYFDVAFNMTTQDGQQYQATCDRTYAQVSNAYQAGKLIRARISLFDAQNVKVLDIQGLPASAYFNNQIPTFYFHRTLELQIDAGAIASATVVNLYYTPSGTIDCNYTEF